MKEEELDYLEAQIPELAEIAFKQAYWQALASGNKVLEAQDGSLVEVSPDGTRKILKPLPPRLTVKPGQKRHRA
jgi:hypothetical protein